MNIQNLKLSICIPTYNRCNYLQRCIESIIGYQGDDIEIIVQDNNSIDDTENIVKSFPDKRIDYRKNSSNIGARLNVRSIIDRAKGEYCFFLTDDDMLVPGVIHIILDFIDKNNPSVFKSDSIVYLEKSNKSYVYSAISKTKSNHDLSNNEKAKIILLSHVLTGLCFKKNDLDLNFYDQNLELWYPSTLIIGMLSNNMGYIAKPITIHTWENEIFWGIDNKDIELAKSESKGILMLEGKIEKELFRILLKKYIIDSGIQENQLISPFHTFEKFKIKVNIYKIRINKLIIKSLYHLKSLGNE